MGEVLDYQEKVSGPDEANTRKALEDLSLLARQPVMFSADDFVAGMLQEMTRVFPQKAAYIGEEGLKALIHEGSAQARSYQLSRGPRRSSGGRVDVCVRPRLH